MANILASNPLTARIAQMFPMQPQDPNTQPQDVSGGFQTSTDVTAPAPNPPINISQRMQDLYHPSNTATDAYTQQLNAMPSRSNYKPTGMQRVLASVAGLGAKNGAEAFNTSRGIINAPYNEAEQDWEARTKAFGEGSRLEEAGNKDKRALAEKQIDQEITAAKEKDIFNTKVADMERKIDEANRIIRIREEQLRVNQNSQVAHENLYQAQIAQRDAQHALDIMKYEETLREHSRKFDEFNRSLLQKEEQLNITREYNKAKAAGQDVSNYIIDKDGNVQYKTTSHKGPAGEEQSIKAVDENGKGVTLKGSQDQIDEWFKANNKRKRAPVQVTQ